MVPVVEQVQCAAVWGRSLPDMLRKAAQYIDEQGVEKLLDVTVEYVDDHQEWVMAFYWRKA